jgi:hypothetical protein
MGHVLGIGTIWTDKGLLLGAGTSNPRFTGANAVAAYNQIFGTTSTSVPVEGNNSPVGSRDSHWRESVFGTELMTPYIAGPIDPLSAVTIASLADLGYTVDMSQADPFTPPSSVSSFAQTTSTSGSVQPQIVFGAPRTAMPLTSLSDAISQVVNRAFDRVGNVSSTVETVLSKVSDTLDGLSQFDRASSAASPAENTVSMVLGDAGSVLDEVESKLSSLPIPQTVEAKVTTLFERILSRAGLR